MATLVHEAFVRSEEYSPWNAGYVAAQTDYPHGEISHQKAQRAVGSSPWSDETLLMGIKPIQPDEQARDELIKAIAGYGLASSGNAPKHEDIDDFIAGSRQGELDIMDGIRL